jgi:glutathione S-transferase
MVLPVVELSDGTILQDTSCIIDALEVLYPTQPIMPSTPLQAVVALLIGAYGSEGLLPAAMHYRWSYRDQQEYFLRAEFGRALEPGPNREKRQAAGAQLMDYFGGMLPTLGVTERTVSIIEQSYLEMLDALDIHLQSYPYILGGRPSIADVGLMGPLFAHLGRDPVPASLMKNRAPNVYRWTERMNSSLLLDGEFSDIDDDFFPNDSIAPTLEPVLKLIFGDWGPELQANAACFDQWLADRPELAEGTRVSSSGEAKVHPTLGMIKFSLRDQIIEKASAPQALWHFSKVLSMANLVTGDAEERLSELLARTGGVQLMSLQLRRQIERRGYSLVLS